MSAAGIDMMAPPAARTLASGSSSTFERAERRVSGGASSSEVLRTASGQPTELEGTQVAQMSSSSIWSKPDSSNGSGAKGSRFQGRIITEGLPETGIQVSTALHCVSHDAI